MVARRSFELTVLTMDRLVLRREVCGAVVPAAGGYLGVQPGHIPCLATLAGGDLILRASRDAEPERAGSVAGGFVEITRDRVTVFADRAEGFLLDEPDEE